MLRALDLFCGAGGASSGLAAAGFNVTGVDIQPQPRYPFAFLQADALAVDLSGFDFIWASPPCQRFSAMSNCRSGLSESYPDLIAAVRDRLVKTFRPYVIENVPGAPLHSPIMLCGAMFGRQTYRHRLFESNMSLTAPPHPRHAVKASKAGHWKSGTFVSVAGNFAPIAIAREAMSIPWMNRRELAEAIPPYFSEYIGLQIAVALAS